MKRWVRLLMALLLWATVLTAGWVLNPAATAWAAAPIYVRPDGDDVNCNGTVDVAYPGSGGPGLACAVQTIQQGVDLVDPGGTVYVAAGTFTENLIIDKSITLSGAGQGNTILYPAVSLPNPCAGSSLCGSATAASNLIVVQADEVTIHDMTLDGDNPALSGGINVGGANVDARNGVVVDYYLGVFDGLEVYSTTVRNIYLRGLYASSGGTFNLHHNTVQNVQGDSGSIAIMNWVGSGAIAYNQVSQANDAIAANHSSGTQFLYNTITQSGSGVHTDNAGDGGGTADLLQGNVVSDCSSGGYGVWVFVPRIAATVQDNTVSGCDVGLAMAGGVTSPVTTLFTGNTVTGTTGSVGVYMTTNQFGWGSGNVAAQFVDNEIRGHNFGFYTEQELGYNLTVTATGNSIADSAVLGMLFDGAGATVATVGGAPGDENVFAGNTMNISVTLPYTNPDILATYNDWGVTALADIEAAIHHQVDDAALAEVLYYTITADAEPPSVLADGSSFAVVTATLGGLYAPAGHTVGFVTDLGTLSAPSAVTDGSGNAVVTIHSTLTGLATITATAGYQSAVATVDFGASPLDHFSLSPVADQVAGVAFAVTITAEDSLDDVVTAYNGYAALSDATGTVAPATVGPFVDGVWSGLLTITSAWVDDVITATHPSNPAVTGSSNSFTVTHNAVVTVTLTPASSTLVDGESITYTVIAQDAYGNSWDATGAALFGIDAGAGGSWSGNVYTSENPGVWTVTATVDGVSDTATLTVQQGTYWIYLPLVMRNYAPMPDLRVAALTVDPAAALSTGAPVTITVVVENVGDAAAGPFWVDLYDNPDPLPTAANQTWNMLCGTTPLADCYGIAWYVGGGLAPGQSVTLTSLGGYQADQTHWLGHFVTSGAHNLYAFADSWNWSVTNGAVEERNEGGDNRRGPTTVSVAANPRFERLPEQEIVIPWRPNQP